MLLGAEVTGEAVGNGVGLAVGFDVIVGAEDDGFVDVGDAIGLLLGAEVVGLGALATLSHN